MNDTIQTAQTKLLQKHCTYNLAETEINKLFDKAENCSKTYLEIKEKRQNYENSFETLENRLVECEKAEKEFEKEIVTSRSLVSELKMRFMKMQNENLEAGGLLSHVKQLVEKLCEERDAFCKNSVSEDLQRSYDECNSYDHELADVRRMLSEFKIQHPFQSKLLENIIENCISQLPLIERETLLERYNNCQFEKQRKNNEQIKNSLLCEIHYMEKQL